MIVQHDKGGGLSAVYEGFRSAEAAQQIIQPCAGEKGAVEAHGGRALGVVEEQFVIEDRLDGMPRRRQRRFQQRVEGGLVVLKGKERGQIGLRVDAALLVGFPVQVNGEGRDDGQLFRKLHQGALHRPLGVPKVHPPGKGQVPVKPGVLEHAAVGFHSEAHEPLSIQLRLRL